MTDKKDIDQPEIYDMSVNNPLAQNYLEKSAFLKFLIQQTKAMILPGGQIQGDVSKHNAFVTQIGRVRNELFSIKKEIQEQIDKFKVILDEINYRRRYTSQLVMHLTKEKSSGEIDQDTYHKKKYELEMKRKSLGNQLQILNRNIEIFKDLMISPVPDDTFTQIEVLDEEQEGSDDIEEGGALSDTDTLMDDSTAGITYMGILSSELEDVIASKKKTSADSSQVVSGEDAEGKNRHPRLNIVTETGRQYYYPLSPNSVVKIGRSSQNDIQIPSPAVSRNHAEISCEKNDYYIVDLESSNGTFVNDKMVIRRKIEPNDTISIGGTRLIFLL